MPNTLSPVPVRSPMLTTEGVPATIWLVWFNAIRNLALKVLGLKGAGVDLPQRSSLNFLAPLTATDNEAGDSIDVGMNLTLPFTVQAGKSDMCPLGSNAGQVVVTFPKPFAQVPVVLCGPDNYPRGGNEPFGCYPTNITETGFTANFNCSVPTGGGGAVIMDPVHANWVALVLVSGA